MNKLDPRSEIEMTLQIMRDIFPPSKTIASTQTTKLPRVGEDKHSTKTPAVVELDDDDVDQKYPTPVFTYQEKKRKRKLSSSDDPQDTTKRSTGFSIGSILTTGDPNNLDSKYEEAVIELTRVYLRTKASKYKIVERSTSESDGNTATVDHSCVIQ